MPRLLVAADDEAVARVLRREGIGVDTFDDAAGALSAMEQVLPDAVVVSCTVSSLDAVGLCRRIRESAPVPIVIILDEQATVEERIAALEAGADDCVPSNYSPRELVLRVEAVLRRAGTGSGVRRLEMHGSRGSIVLDRMSRRVVREGTELQLTDREFDLLHYLLRNEGEALSRERILRDVWGWDFGDLSTVTTHVRRLRLKLESDPNRPELITTIWGIGYRLDAG